MPVHNPARTGWLAMVLLAVCMMLPSVAAARPVTIKAMMILASNESSAQDPRLSFIEFKLRRVTGFEYFRHYGEGSAVLNVPGNTEIDLGHGFRLAITALKAEGGRLKAHVSWLREGTVLLNTVVSAERGTPFALGGIAHEGGTLIVTLTAK